MSDRIRIVTPLQNRRPALTTAKIFHEIDFHRNWWNDLLVVRMKASVIQSAAVCPSFIYVISIHVLSVYSDQCAERHCKPHIIHDLRRNHVDFVEHETVNLTWLFVFQPILVSQWHTKCIWDNTWMECKPSILLERKRNKWSTNVPFDSVSEWSIGRTDIAFRLKFCELPAVSSSFSIFHRPIFRTKKYRSRLYWSKKVNSLLPKQNPSPNISNIWKWIHRVESVPLRWMLSFAQNVLRFLVSFLSRHYPNLRCLRCRWLFHPR